MLQPYCGNEVIETSVLGDGAAPGQHKRDEKEQEGGDMSHPDYRKQCKTSNHSSARELEPVEKDPAPSMLNCG